MSERDREALRNAGLAHLLAISGLHIGIVCGLLYAAVFQVLARIEWLALRMPLQKPAAIIALIGGATYLVISGASVSTQRAFIMAALVFVAVLIDRHAISLRTFAIAMIAVIILQAESVLSPGFQMSFAATGVLIAIYEQWRQQRHGALQGFGSQQIFVVKSLFVTSVAAGVATAPFAFYHFDRIAPYGLLANILAMPIVTFLTAPAAAVALILAPFGLSDFGLRIFGWSLDRILDIAHWTAALSASSGPQWKAMPHVSLLLFSAGIAAFILFKYKLRKMVVSVLVGGATIIWIMSTPPSVFWAPSGDVYIRQNNSFLRIAFLEKEGLGPLRYKDLDYGGYCRNRRCLVRADNEHVLLTQGLDEDECVLINESAIVLTANKAKCERSVSFNEIENKGGAAIWLSRADPKIVFVQKCEARPWQPKCDR